MNQMAGIMIKPVKVQVFHWKLKGNPVKTGSEPVAVIGDENCRNATVLLNLRREGAVSKMIRKPEDLPERIIQ